MERAPSRAKATNILRPASRAQGAAFSPDPLSKQQQQQQQITPVSAGTGAGMAQQPARVLPGGARLLVSSAAGGAMQPLVGMPGMPGMPLNSPGGLRRPPSSSQFNPQQIDPSAQMGFGGFNPQQPPVSAGVGGGQRLSSYYDGMPPAMGDPSMVPQRSISRSGSRAELTQQLQQGLPQRSSSRAGLPNMMGPGPGPAGMWGAGPLGQMGLNNFFGGGFGSMGGDMMNPASPMLLQQQQQMMMMNNLPPGGRPGSSLHMNAPHQPARPATSTGFRSSGADSDSPMVVNVARGGARVIGPMRAKQPGSDQPSFLNPIPQSPSSVLGALIPEPQQQGSTSFDARDHVRSALSNNSLGSTHSRSNSMLPPTEELIEAAEARVDRKIQDLEISNKSLLAVNSQLEARVKAQREQINELKKQIQMREPFISESLADNDVPDEALRSALKEDKVFERLISNLELLIQDAKSALEYRSMPAAGKVINTIDMNEDDSQLTVGKSPDPQSVQKADGAAEGTGDTMPSETIDGQAEEDDAGERGVASAADAIDPDKKSGEDDQTADSAETDAKLQEARELVARLMVLALSSPEPAPTQVPPSQTDKAGSRIPRRTGSGAGAAANPTARPQSALKGGLRTPMKSAGMRISSFGVASENTPVRSTVVSPTPSGKASSLSGSAGKDSQNASGLGAAQPADREQILDICRKLQQIL
ncbi:hypothetical protein GGI15_000156 [Coemansia interrupta]|uniref:Uncharacterized protein n=1 Tax=Coemansia interrupta TaxID=1126814 RepID=A0A9W8HSN6_9FUNG|nr:hypothetical protein GGI15_000156 [Coemansia interrupta]